MSKALDAALEKRALMVAANAPADSIAVVDARIAALTPKPKSKPESAQPTVETVFAGYEPAHVAAVVAGAAPRWVVGPDSRWYIAARADQVDWATGEVTVERRDGSVSVEVLDAVFATMTTASGSYIAVFSKVDAEAVEVALTV